MAATLNPHTHWQRDPWDRMVSMPLLDWEVVDRPYIGRAEMGVTPSLTCPPHPHLSEARVFLLLGSVVPRELTLEEGEL